MESKVPLTPVRSRTWHATTEKVPIPTVKRPATTLGITHPPAVTSTAVIRRPVTRPKTTAGTWCWCKIMLSLEWLFVLCGNYSLMLQNFCEVSLEKLQLFLIECWHWRKVLKLNQWISDDCLDFLQVLELMNVSEAGCITLQSHCQPPACNNISFCDGCIYIYLERSVKL